MNDLFGALAIVCTALCAPNLAASDRLLTNVTLVDVETATIAAGQLVLIVGNGIAEIGTSLSAPEGTPLFNAKGTYLIPGLWDAHVHVSLSPTEPDSALPLHLIYGVTGNRHVGGPWPTEEKLALHARVETGD
jgi:adenine deaminase